MGMTEQGRRPATEKDRSESQIGRFRRQSEFRDQGIDKCAIRQFARLMLVKAAVGADVVAKGNVDVEMARQREEFSVFRTGFSGFDRAVGAPRQRESPTNLD